MASTITVGFILVRFRQTAIQKEALRKLQEEIQNYRLWHVIPRMP